MHVGIVMGSDSDLPVMKKAFAILDDFGVTYDVTIASAHRTPKKLADFVAAEERRALALSSPAPVWQLRFRVWWPV